MKKRLEDIIHAAFHGASEVGNSQTLHRVDLVNFWNPPSGSRILEVGCGPGDTTVVLAAAAGYNGHVLAVERAPAKKIWALTGLPFALTEADLPFSPQVEQFLARYVCGSSPGTGTPMSALLASKLGNRVTFQLGLDLLDPRVDFGENQFDMVVFSHCSWYFEHPRILAALFQRTRRWAKSLAYAEWNILPVRYAQTTHLLAALLQAQILALCPSAFSDAVSSGGGLYNIVSVIPPSVAREMAESAGWTVARQMEFDSSGLQDAVWEGRVAHELADEFAPLLPDYARSVVESHDRVLSDMENLVGGCSSRLPEDRKRLIREGKIQALSTHAFLAV